MDTNKFAVYQLTLDGGYYEISPEGGFAEDGSACAYACGRASSHAGNRSFYLVISGSEIVAVYPGAGLVDFDADRDPGADLLWAA